LRKASISFVKSVGASVRLSARMEQLGSHWTDFPEIWNWIIFLKIQGEHKVFPSLQTFITRKLRGIQTVAHVEVY